MNANQPERLHEIATSWTQVQLALHGEGPAAVEAQGELFQRYAGAIRRYLQSALRDPGDVDDLMQNFGLALVSGRFRGLEPERGRFRDYLKGVLFRLVQQHRREQQRDARQLPEDIDLADPEAYPAACDEQFRQSWRDELLSRAWEELSNHDPHYFTVLHYRASHPELRSQQMAPELSHQLGKPVTAQAVRQTLRRARKRYTDLLLKQVAASLEYPVPSAIHEELRDLELASFVLSPRKG